jgi:alpha-galactosidase
MKNLMRFALFVLCALCYTSTKAAGSNLFGDTIVLPVRWVSFSATKKDDKVVLNWTTLHEQFTKAFVIERSHNGRDFQAIGSMNASGDSYSNLSYIFYDRYPMKGMNCYRIRQVDENNDYSFSEIRKVNFSSGDNQIKLIGNVVTSGTLNIKISQTKRKPVSVKIFSRQGILMVKRELTEGSYSIDVSGLQKGFYFLQADNENKDFLIQ